MHLNFHRISIAINRLTFNDNADGGLVVVAGLLSKSNKASGKPAGELKYFQTILHLWEDKVLILFQLFIANDYNKATCQQRFFGTIVDFRFKNNSKELKRLAHVVIGALVVVAGLLSKSNKASGKPAGELKYFQTILHLWEDKVLILFQLFIANDYNKDNNCVKALYCVWRVPSNDDTETMTLRAHDDDDNNNNNDDNRNNRITYVFANSSTHVCGVQDQCLKSRWVGEPNTAAGGTKGEKADFKGNGGDGGTCGGEFVAATAEAIACETSSPDNITSIVCKTSPR
uniref:Uncharacterized protein n=1 Tax=Glossina palpalis gambiensis TaxID=67801 RepID=A0A1B0B6S3_9MUSC